MMMVALGGEALHGHADALLGAGVDGGGRVVETRTAGRSTRLRAMEKPAALAARERHAALSDDRPIAGRQADDMVCSCAYSAALDALLLGPGLP